jgi:predicted transposase/invertase (TIGR01784 family)
MHSEVVMKDKKKRNPFSPRNDHYFKRLFGDERNIEILSAFLKAALDIPVEEYDEIHILDKETTVNRKNDKFTILDIKLTTKSGSIIDIEIQRFFHKAFRNRVVFQESRLIGDQLSQGDSYDKLHRAICLVITEFAFIKEDNYYHHDYELRDKRTGAIFSDIINVHTFELEKLPETDDGEPAWDWLKFMDSDEVGDMEAIAENNKDLNKATTLYKRLLADKNERILAEKALESERERWSITEYARDEGRDEGLKEGLSKAINAAAAIGLSDEQLDALKKALKE